MKTLNLIVIFSLFFFSCEKQSTDLNTEPETIGQMALQIDMSQAPAGVAKIIGTLARSGYEDRIFRFNIEGETATAAVDNIPAGVWKLKVDAYNQTDVIIYTGATDVYVASGAVTPVHLVLNPATGSIYITVTWGDSERQWGEIVNGMRISINLNEKELEPWEQAYSNILIEQVEGDSAVRFEAYVSFGLYDKANVLRYTAFFNLNAEDPAIDYHPKSVISFHGSALINRTVEITQLGWVLPISSKPPDAEFYNLIAAGKYTLRMTIEPVGQSFPNQNIISNPVGLSIKGTEPDKVIYFNSFENDADTAGIGGYGEWSLSNDASPGGGKNALHVSGGCIWPHVKITIPPLRQAGSYILSGWGKNLAIGGSVELYRNYPDHTAEDHIGFSVTDSTWQQYKSDKKLRCSVNDTLTLIMGAGGFIPSAMLVDQIQISRIE